MVPWLIITGSGLYDWIYWHLLYKLSESQLITITHNQSSAEPFFVDCRGLAPFSFSFYDWFIHSDLSQSQSQSQSQSYFTIGGLPQISSSWLRAPRASQPECFFFFSHLNTCGHSPYITSSLTRRRVCHLKLLLTLANAFILGSDSRVTRDHMLLSQFRDFPFRRLLRLAGSRCGSIENISVAPQRIHANHRENTASSIVVFTERCIKTEIIRLLPAYSLSRIVVGFT
jgi:hypothetical protein